MIWLTVMCDMTCSFSGNASPRAGRGAERERRVCLRLHRGAPANASPDLPLRHDQIRITPPQVHTPGLLYLSLHCCAHLKVFFLVTSLSLSLICCRIFFIPQVSVPFEHMGKWAWQLLLFIIFQEVIIFLLLQLHCKLKKSFQFT